MKIRFDELTRRIRIHRYRVSTVRHMFPIMAVSLGILGATYLAGGSSYVILTPDPAYVESGKEVEISVDAVAHTPVNAIDVEVAFPSDQLKIIGVETGGSVITLWTSEPKAEGNKVVLRGGTYRKGFLGRHTIARIRARAVNEGDADVLVRNSVFLAGDGKGTPISIDSSDNQKAAIQIGGPGSKVTVKSGGTTLSGKVAIAVITDIDGDKDVDLSDIQAFMNAWRTGVVIYDFSGDGRMTFRDFAILLSDSFFK